ncbi:HTH-type transcriptional repressor GlcR [Paenibacillus sp. J23TS9]|uniref:DeoR/GlpR family DNA-binding transcription regulator n=1 Tax=Paenibacillus sp. J23TS9 TaxID=2807193 RepID=UPI001AFDFF40|nr:DeoR/GlpR family DNA-binding transcription regulator [Paenibacillus sp. J23TS9]GIP26184.1 HTH-type transcriptional repressor GlcR [Paenibacillus sp. J23TS9]
MNQEERYVHILEFLDEHNTMSLQQICELFGVSRDTARRDIVHLSSKGLVSRTHGGIAVPSLYRKLRDYESRSKEKSEVKLQIGEQAAKLIEDDDLIFMDISTTVHAMTQFMNELNVQVVTNSIDIANTLTHSVKPEVHLLGGTVNKISRHVFGYSTLSKISDYQFNKVFIGAAGITSKGIYYGNEEEIEFKRELVKHAGQTFLLIDHTKHNLLHKFRALDLKAVDHIITNHSLPLEIVQRLDADVQVMVIGEHDYD